MSCPASLCARRNTLGRSLSSLRRFRLNSANPVILMGSIAATGSPPLFRGQFLALRLASEVDAPPNELVVAHLAELCDRAAEPLGEEELELSGVVVLEL